MSLTCSLLGARWPRVVFADTRDRTVEDAGGGVKRVSNFVRMPFGCVNSAAKLMDKVLGFDLEPKVFVSLDDIVINSKTFEEHLELLVEVARRMKIANLTVNSSKSKFCQREIAFLGYILS
jgi:hypothetical protein